MSPDFSNFLASSIKVWDSQTDDVFYIYPDNMQSSRDLPESLDDAYGNGWLTIEATSPGLYAMTIGNTDYTDSSRYNLELILFDWAKSEGYHWS